MTLAELAPTYRLPRGFHRLRVGAVDRLTPDAVAVTFEVPEDLRDAYAFAPGQSLTLRRVVDGREQRRSYSICAPAGQALRIGVREVPDGLFSTWLVREVRAGDVLEVQVPAGGLRADPAAGGRHLCIAVGSGITPLLSIAASVLAHPEARVMLLYGNRTTASVMFADELADLKDEYGPRLELVHVLSREPREVELFSGRLDADRLRRLLEELVPVADVDHVWLCGPYPMIGAAREVLAEAGIPADRVHVEHFHVDSPPPPPRRAPTETVAKSAKSGPEWLGRGSARLTVTLDGRSTSAAVARDVPVLDSAQRLRGDLPFACRGGVCGTCRARVASGEVEMVRNFALEDAEVAAGFVLTCQSYPVSDDVEVDYDA
jgi:ring-1,2-phenylacetyl-CoA epoxidase subunit PaaE